MDSNWVLVIFTAIYVIATIAICVANFKSANASKKQLEEMKKQYEDDNRPFVEAEFHYERRVWYILRFVNHGKRTAQHFTVELDQAFINSLPEATFRSELEKQKGKECIIGVGQHYDLYIGSNKLRETQNWNPLVGKIKYQSNGNTFESDIYIDIENYMGHFSAKTEHDDLMNVIKETNISLSRIEQAISRLSAGQKEDDSNA